MVQMNENIVGLTLLFWCIQQLGKHQDVDAFNDPIDNKDSKEDTEQMFWLKIMLKKYKKQSKKEKLKFVLVML
jgi:hypothetical protein